VPSDSSASSRKYLLWVRTFITVEEFRRVPHPFKDRYNHEWILGRHSYPAPRKVSEAKFLGVAQPA
jgi:hypothetical protein